MYFLLVGAIIYTYSTAIYLTSAMIYLIGNALYIIPVLQFDAEDEEGNISTHDSVLSVEPVKHTETYSLEDEQWSIYSNGVMKTGSSPGMSGLMFSCYRNPSSRARACTSSNAIRVGGKIDATAPYQCGHSASLGRDPCKENMLLARVRAGNKTCSICNRVLASTQFLRNHIWSAHIDETCYQVLVIPMCYKCISGNISQNEGCTSAVLWQRLCHIKSQKPALGGSLWEVSPMPVLWDNIHPHKITYRA